MIGSIGWASWMLWGFAATVVLTTLMAASQGLGLTRMSMTYLVGSVVTPDRDRAQLVGIPIHLVDGWVFSFVYVIAFHTWHGPAWWKGAAIGAIHAAFVLSVALPALPALHPRMASETRGPTVVRQLEPPGFLGLHYGTGTPLSVMIAHVVFGTILGVFYTPVR